MIFHVNFWENDAQKGSQVLWPVSQYIALYCMPFSIETALSEPLDSSAYEEGRDGSFSDGKGLIIIQ